MQQHCVCLIVCWTTCFTYTLHARTHARTHSRTHSRAHARTHALTHSLQVVFVWSNRTADPLTWIEDTLVAAQGGGKGGLEVELILNLTKSKTMEAAAEELARVSGGAGSGSSGSSDGAAGGGLASLEVLPGRPDYAALFARLEEENAGVGVGAVSVCGPGPMVDSVQQTRTLGFVGWSMDRGRMWIDAPLGARWLLKHSSRNPPTPLSPLSFAGLLVVYDRNSSAFEWRFARETFLM